MTKKPKTPTRCSIALGELLAQYKREGESDFTGAAVVIADHDAIKVLTAFRGLAEHQWEVPMGEPPDRPSDRWKWIVSTWTVNFTALGSAAGVSGETAKAKFNMLVGNRLVYPDGSISKGARLAIETYVMRAMGLKAQRPEKPEPKKEPEKA